MSDFSLVWPIILRHEGGFSDNPKDPGGPTKYGISLRFLKGLGSIGDIDHDGDIDRDDILALTQDDAANLYFSEFWNRYSYGSIVYQSIANKVCDITVNMGAVPNHILLQRSLCDLGSNLVVDGVIGPKSLAAVNATNPVQLMSRYKVRLLNHYNLIVQTHPDLGWALQGWVNRVNDMKGMEV